MFYLNNQNLLKKKKKKKLTYGQKNITILLDAKLTYGNCPKC